MSGFIQSQQARSAQQVASLCSEQEVTNQSNINNSSTTSTSSSMSTSSSSKETTRVRTLADQLNRSKETGRKQRLAMADLQLQLQEFKNRLEKQEEAQEAATNISAGLSQSQLDLDENEEERDLSIWTDEETRLLLEIRLSEGVDDLFVNQNRNEHSRGYTLCHEYLVGKNMVRFNVKQIKNKCNNLFKKYKKIRHDADLSGEGVKDVLLKRRKDSAVEKLKLFPWNMIDAAKGRTFSNRTDLTNVLVEDSMRPNFSLPPGDNNPGEDEYGYPLANANAPEPVLINTNLSNVNSTGTAIVSPSLISLTTDVRNNQPQSSSSMSSSSHVQQPQPLAFQSPPSTTKTEPTSYQKRRQLERDNGILTSLSIMQRQIFEMMKQKEENAKKKLKIERIKTINEKNRMIAWTEIAKGVLKGDISAIESVAQKLNDEINSEKKKEEDDSNQINASSDEFDDDHNDNQDEENVHNAYDQ
jgi:hypothetical protein